MFASSIITLNIRHKRGIFAFMSTVDYIECMSHVTMTMIQIDRDNRAERLSALVRIIENAKIART